MQDKYPHDPEPRIREYEIESPKEQEQNYSIIHDDSEAFVNEQEKKRQRKRH